MVIAIINFVGCTALFALSFCTADKLTVHVAFLVAMFVSAHAAIAEYKITVIKRGDQ